MKVAALVTVKNEVDVLSTWLDYMSNHVDYFLFRDNNSTDGSSEIMKNHKKTVFYEVVDGKFTCSMNDKLIAESQKYLSKKDWFIIAAPDLFPFFFVRNEIEKAMKKNCNCISTYYLNFFFTKEMFDKYNIDKEYREKINNFNLDNYEYFYNLDKNPSLIIQNKPGVHYEFPKQEPPFIPNKLEYKDFLCFAHYRFRSPEQIKKRLKIRKEVNPNLDGNFSFGFYSSWNWKDYLLPQKMLHKFEPRGFKQEQMERSNMSKILLKSKGLE
jgi:hypothetical protein